MLSISCKNISASGDAVKARAFIISLPSISIKMPSVRGESIPSLIASVGDVLDSAGSTTMPSGCVTVAVAEIEPETPPIGVDSVSPAATNTTRMDSANKRKVTDVL